MNFFQNINRFLQLLFPVLIIATGVSCRTNKNIAVTEIRITSVEYDPFDKIREKYACLLNVDQNEITNIALYGFIDEWYGIPYKYGGKTKNGIDCSNFATILYNTIYCTSLTGPTTKIYTQCKTIETDSLMEGDLLFFKINVNDISHMGIYLKHNKFVHTSSKKGVMIDDLSSLYYKKHFFKAGRLSKHL